MKQKRWQLASVLILAGLLLLMLMVVCQSSQPPYADPRGPMSREIFGDMTCNTYVASGLPIDIPAPESVGGGWRFNSVPITVTDAVTIGLKPDMSYSANFTATIALTMTNAPAELQTYLCPPSVSLVTGPPYVFSDACADVITTSDLPGSGACAVDVSISDDDEADGPFLIDESTCPISGIYETWDSYQFWYDYIYRGAQNTQGTWRLYVGTSWDGNGTDMGDLTSFSFEVCSEDFGTPTPTNTPTASNTPTNTPTNAPTNTRTPTYTPTNTPTPNLTQTQAVVQTVTARAATGTAIASLSTPTGTPRPTSTPNTPTPTRTATSTPSWPALNCPAITPNVNATLSEWSNVTPIALSYTSANVVQPATPVAPTPDNTGTPTVTPGPTPSTADISGTLYCGYAGNTIYFAGTILDATITAGTTYSTNGSISQGDALRITLDGKSDGFADPLGDDHDLYISPGGRVLDFDTHPISTTLAVGTGGGGWTFEIGIDASTLELGTLASGIKWGQVWHLLDADDGNGLQHILDDRKRWATIP